MCLDTLPNSTPAGSIRLLHIFLFLLNITQFYERINSLAQFMCPCQSMTKCVVSYLGVWDLFFV